MTADKPEHEIELVFRFRTNMDQSELDDFLCGASETLFADYRGEDSGEREVYSIYLPTGSHWRDITPGYGGYRYASGSPLRYDPSATELSGGNQLGPGRKPTPVPE